MATRTSRSRSRAHARGAKTMAQRADVHELYERAVQDPPTDVQFFAKTYRKIRGHEPVSMREDFCGTAALSLAWVRAGANRTALGVDLSRETMAWGRVNRIEPAGAELADRVELRCGDVREVGKTKVDLTCALNFSYCTFKTRPALLEYFTAVRRGLNRDGVFILDLLGGAESMGEDITDNDLGDFVYRWEQARFNVVTHDILCHIHFLFPDGSKIERAFSYDWRLWTAPELRELLLEAGFSKVHFYWEKTDRRGDGTGVFYEPSYVENQDLWWTFMAAER